MTADVTVEVVDPRKNPRDFFGLAERLYRGDPNWVPPLVFERLQHLNPRKNPFFEDAEVRYWIARRNGLATGRISAQVNRAYLAVHRDATGHFGFLEAEDDAEVFAALLGAAETWLKKQGMQRITGPFTLSINDESGLLIEGFDSPPYLMMNHAHPFYRTRLEEQGYAKIKDLIAYDYDLTTEMNPLAKALMERAQANSDLVIRPFDMSRFADELKTVVDIFNDAWAGNWGFVPMSEAEARYMAQNLRPLITAEFGAIAEIDGYPVAMAVTLPNVNEAAADLRGRLLPFGWAKLLWRLKVRGTRSARLALMGVRREHHGTFLGAALAAGVIDQVRRCHMARGTLGGELSWVLEDNLPTRKIIEMAGAKAYKTYRIFAKDLA